MSKDARTGKRAARERAAEERAKQQERDKRRRRLVNGAVAVVVVLVVAGIGIYVASQVTDDGPTGAALPALVPDGGTAVVLGDGPVDVELWEDFQCPGCKAFEGAYGEMLRKRVEQGDVTLTIHPLSFLDEKLDNTSSALAANAFGCVTDAGEQQALDFHLTVYANQPEEQPGTDAWDAGQLIAWGNDVGATGATWEECVNTLAYSDWVSQVQASMSEAGIHSTPTVFLDGDEFDLATGDFTAAVDAAVNDSK